MKYENMKLGKATEHKFSTEILRFVKVFDWRPRAVYELEELYGSPLDVQLYHEELSTVRITFRTALR